MKLIWTYEKCANEALKYKTRMEFKHMCAGAYWAANKHRWLNIICNHMTIFCKPKRYWTYERCSEIALKYKTIKDFRENSISVYNAVKKNKWLDEICSHMIRTGNRYNKCIYSYEFNDKSVYVGLTFNLENRQMHRNHDINDQVVKHANESGLIPIRKQLTDYIPVDEAIKMEALYVNKYNKEGWNILNKAKTGSIGGNIIIWTYDKCKILALGYTSRRKFKLAYPGAYNAAHVNRWIDEICSHMKMAYHPKGYWNYENCRKEASKYEKSYHFKLKCQFGWNVSRKNNWLNEFFKK